MTMAVIHYMSKITNAIPAPLAGMGFVRGFAILFGIDVPRFGDLASIKGGLPSFHIPMGLLNFEMLQTIFSYALFLAAIGLLESLLTLNLVDKTTER